MPGSSQSQLQFDPPPEPPAEPRAVAVATANPSVDDDFSFTIAIGRCAPSRAAQDARMLIDVSVPLYPNSTTDSSVASDVSGYAGLYPAAPLEERRLSAIIDFACLLFAYGGFLTLFGSMGGHFTLSKLSSAICVITFAIVYLQYFALFTVFGGTTPGMMFRGLQVVSFTGEAPTPRQMLLRSFGYVLSAGTFFMGFFWVWWDEDALTWHDRLSRTYLSSDESQADLDVASVAHTR
ncbi:MAG TPA: RDD family protein [Candidatus Acidoferrum sp.]